MFPVLVDIAGYPLRTYGVAIAAAFLVATIVGARSAKRQAISVVVLLDLAFWVLVSALLGSRLLFVITHAADYYHVCVSGTGVGGGARSIGQVLFDCSRSLHLWEGGLVFYGGLLAATIVSYFHLRRHEVNFYRVADLAVPAIALGHAIGRIGCFGAGCCYGSPTGSRLGIRFGMASFALQDMQQSGKLPLIATHTPLLHPTQLYEALVELSLFGVLTWFNSRKRRYFGQTFVLYLALYAPLRAVIELFRADPARKFIWALSTPALAALLGLPEKQPLLLSTSQLISLLVIIFAVVLGRRLSRRSAAPAPNAAGQAG